MNSKPFIDAIRALNPDGNKSFSSLFEDFVDLALCLLCNNPDERQIKLWEKANRDKAFSKAFGNAMQEYGKACEDFQDPLGDAYMELVSHGEHGQFFTPTYVCDFMAEVVGMNDDSVSDPTCGSGRMLLSALKSARQKGKEPFLYGNDLCMICSKMTLLNLLVNTARGEVSCGNALEQNYDGFVFFHIDRIKVGKIYVSSYWRYMAKDVDAVNVERNKWIETMAENGIVVESDEKVSYASPDELHPSPVTEESVADVLVAKPKTKAVQLDLFEEF